MRSERCADDGDVCEWRLLSRRAQNGGLGDRLVSYFHHKLNRQTQPEPPWMAPGSLCSVARGLSRREPTLIAQLIAANHRNCSLTQQLHGCRISFAFLGCSLIHWCSLVLISDAVLGQETR